MLSSCASVFLSLHGLEDLRLHPITFGRLKWLCGDRFLEIKRSINNMGFGCHPGQSISYPILSQVVALNIVVYLDRIAESSASSLRLSDLPCSACSMSASDFLNHLDHDLKVPTIMGNYLVLISHRESF